MSRILRAELRRLGVRRLPRAMLVAVVVAGLAGGLITFLTTAPLSESAYRQRVRDADSRAQVVEARARQCVREHQPPGSTARPSEAVIKLCFPDRFPRAHDPRFHRTRLRGLLQGGSAILALAGWLIGASLIGTEYSSRSLTTTLLSEARRGRLFFAKAAAAVIAGTVVATAGLAAAVAALLPVLLLHGAPATGEPGIAALVGVGLRGTALTAAATAIGFSLALLGRSTAAALGTGFGYVIILENVLGGAFPRWRRWLLLGNTIVFLSGRDSGGDVPGRSVTAAALILLSVVTVAVAAAVTLFRIRDVG